MILLRFLVPMIVFSAYPVNSETYPEYTGNYIECSGKWCTLEAYQLSVMSLWQKLSSTGSNIVMYSGFFEIPEEVPSLNSQKPRFLIYSGRQQADPRTVALVQLEKLPYNNAPIGDLNEKRCNMDITYSSKNIKSELWTFKREVLLRFKPVDGKIGMFIFEPAEPLMNGFYVIDSGLPATDGHSNLTTKPAVMGYYKLNHVLTALPFVIGERKNISTSSEEKDETSSLAKPDIEPHGQKVSPNGQTSSNTQDTLSQPESEPKDQKEQSATGNINKAINGVLKGFFGGKQ